MNKCLLLCISIPPCKVWPTLIFCCWFWQYNFLHFKGYLPILMLLTCLVFSEYLANFIFIKRWTSYVMLMCILMFVYVSVLLTYYLFWVYGLGLTPPMAFSQYIPASVGFAIMNVAIWFRYFIFLLQICFVLMAVSPKN